jgi:large conductance mechanosensitive channel
MGLVKEFREFAVKGNVMDLAVGVIIGAAFGKIVSALVDDLVMPPLGLLLGGVDFSQKFVSLRGQYPTLAEAQAAGAPVLAYGHFLQTVFDFFLVACAVFLLVKVVNAARRKQEDAPAAVPPAPTEEVLLLREIRDALKK